jgi:hypothetical protein
MGKHLVIVDTSMCASAYLAEFIEIELTAERCND